MPKRNNGLQTKQMIKLKLTGKFAKIIENKRKETRKQKKTRISNEKNITSKLVYL